MTGFGKSNVSLGAKQLSIDIRALNSKQFDLNLRIPGVLRSREAEIRQQIAAVLERGKIDCYIISKQSTGSVEINEELLHRRYTRLNNLAQNLGASSNELLPALLTLPDALQDEENEIMENEWNIFREALLKAISNTNDFRITEGKGLTAELSQRVNNIQKNLSDISSIDSERTELIRTKLLQKVEQLAVEFDRNRFEEELIYYIEKLDISEEKQRLSTHCTYFLETMQDKESNGRKLGFIAQEMGREINTIGSKANHAGIQKLVVLMKDELEKIKEQLNNIV